MAGDGGMADIGFSCTLHSWFRREKCTTIMLDNEVYGNAAGQESGMTTRGAVLKMAPLGKKFDKMDMIVMAKIAWCAYAATVVPNNPRGGGSVIKKAVLIAREIGPTYVQAYTSCHIEYAIPTDKVMEDAKTVEDDRWEFNPSMQHSPVVVPPGWRIPLIQWVRHLLSWVCEWTERSVPVGKYCRRNLFVFSLVPRCQGLRGSQKHT